MTLTRLARCAAASGQDALAFLLSRRALSLQPDNRDLQEFTDTMLARADALNKSDSDMSYPRPNSVYWLAIAVGQDSNINGGSNSREVTLPLLGNRRVSLNDLLISHESSVVEANFGASFNYPLSPSLSLHAIGLGGLRYNAAEAAYLPHNYRASVEIEASPKWGRFGVGMATTQRWLARFHLLAERLLSAHVDYFITPDLLADATIFRTARLYPYFDDYRAHRDDFGLGVTHLSSGLRLGLAKGRQRGDGERRELDFRSDGFALDWNWQMTQAYRLRVSWQETRDRYERMSILFRTRREDRTQTQSVEIEYGLGGKWFLTPRYMREETRSNLALARMQREQLLLELRREF